MITLILMASTLLQSPEPTPQPKVQADVRKDAQSKTDRKDKDDVANTTPEEAFRTFMIAMLTHDEATLRAVTVKTDDFDWLLKGDPVPPEHLEAAKRDIQKPLRALKAGDEVKLPGNRKVTVQPEEVTADRAVLVADWMAVPTRMWKVDGRWRVDAVPLIAARKAADAAQRKKAAPNKQ